MKPRVFVASPLPEDLVVMIREQCEVAVYDGPGPIAPDALIAALAGVDGVIGSAQTPYRDGVLASAASLRVICNVGVGFDNVDLAEATARGISVANTPGVLSDAVADLVLAMMITAARRMPEAAAIAREGRWGTPQGRIRLGVDLKAKTLALIGFGRIGREVADRALACKMRVVFFDTRDGVDVPAGVERASTLDEALAQADFVSMHVDLNPRTHHLMGEREFGLMKPGAFFINAARGAVVDQRALYAALVENRIAGAALDVLEREPPDPDDLLLALDNVYVLPHIGSATVETRRAMADLAVQNLLACLRGDPCACIVNPRESLSS